MVQTSTSLPENWSDRILCYYENVTNQVQIARLANTPDWFERVVFPRQRLLFEALPGALLEVRTNSGTIPLLDQILCLRLQVKGYTRPLLNLSDAIDG